MAKRVRVAEGAYRDKYGISAVVTVGSGASALRSERRFGRDESLRVMAAWRRTEREKLETLRPHTAARGSFDANIGSYLQTLADRPALQALRKRHLAWFADFVIANHAGREERLGDRRRYTLTAAEFQTALAAFASTPIVRWHGHPARLPTPATVRHYRTALYHLYTTLDGKNAPNPLRDVKPPRSADPEPRAIPYEIIEAIFDRMPERGQGIRDRARGESSKTKRRLAVMAYTGLPPAQVMRLRPESVDWAGRSVLVSGRNKGRGSRAVRLPLAAQGLDALRHFFAAGAHGRFSTSSARTSWRRAIQAMVDQLAAVDFRAAKVLYDLLSHARPYDLRHSNLTEAFLASGDIRATQALAMHSDSRMTNRYTLAAVNPRMREVADLLSARLHDASKRSSTHSLRALAHNSGSARTSADCPKRTTRAG